MLAALLLLSGCGNRYSNVEEFASGHDQTLVLVRRQWDDRLGYLEPGNRLVLIDAIMDRLGTIESIRWSPSGRFFLIESYGEGDQNISIYEYSALVVACERRTGEIPAFRKLDPYLHSLSAISWESDLSIRFSSVGDFSQFDRKSRRALVDHETEEQLPDRRWSWDLANNTFRSVP